MSRCYFALLRHPRALIGMLAAVFLMAMWFWPHLRYDASSETLVVEGDQAFAEYVALSERFPGDTFVLLTFQPHEGSPFRRDNLRHLATLQAAVASLAGVSGTLSVLDVPLLSLPGRPQLLAGEIDAETAAGYFLSSPLFVSQLVSVDGGAVSIKVDLDPAADDQRRGLTLEAIRERMSRFTPVGELRIGGVPLIAHDMVRYVERDVRVFGLAALVIMVGVLWMFFRRSRWVALCIGSAVYVVGIQVGVLGALDVPVSVISANFVSILGILSLSFLIHLVVRYRELLQLKPPLDQRTLVERTLRSKFLPCLYTALTTIVAFSSLVVSGIPPVEDFGWMMALGVALALLFAYLLFPAVLLVLPRGRPSPTLGQRLRVNEVLSALCVRRPVPVVAAASLLLLGAMLGMSKLTLDSHFSQYFRSGSDIREGLEYIDARFGGVLPLEVVVRFEPYAPVEMDEDDDFFVESDVGYPQSIWFDQAKTAQVGALGRSLREMPEVGSATSIADLADLGALVMRSERLDDVQLALLVAGLGEEGRKRMVSGYANPQSGEMRIALRMRESSAPANYNAVVRRVRQLAFEAASLDPADVQVTGMYVLFGESIRTLFDSQRSTILYVLVGTFLMFLLLLRAPLFGLLGVLANSIAAACVLGIMGFAGLPLDMMTITIAAIVIGISVDDAIHYLSRYRAERSAGLTAREAVAACHRSIGRAIYFTSVTVVLGFCVLAFSRFVPSIYFGLLTSLAMAAALLANLLVLPSLLILCDDGFARIRARNPRMGPPRVTREDGDQAQNR